jgi:hypothetical protein
MTCQSEGATHHNACDCREEYVKRLEAVARAADMFLKRLEVVTNDEAYIRVWEIYWMHMGPYKGPQYKQKFDELKENIAALEEVSNDIF